jgi:hypothetical protein
MDSERQPSLDEVYARPSVVEAPVEAIVARQTVRRAIVVGPMVVTVTWLLRGSGGAAAAAIGVAIVVANFLLAGMILSRAAAVSLKVYHAAALLGFVVRLGLITVSMFVIASVFEVDRPAMGIAAVVAYFTLLTWEAWALAKGPGRELEWTS